MQDHVELLVAQQLVYNFLGRVFYEAPTEVFIQPIITDALFEDWPLASENQAMQTGLVMLREFCQTPPDNSIRALVQDYTRLFFAPGDGFVRPWESVYRSKDHILFDQETFAVRQQYQRFGMTIPNVGLEPEDHLGLEFRFVAHLCSLALVALERGESAVFDQTVTGLRNFQRDHLNKWAPECLQCVISDANTVFYRGVAHLALGCLAQTGEILRVWEDEAHQWILSNSR
ncbi:MAG: molecular chaperone TorD family protein [Anaerolineae bacterium]|nr:molecular chaperone TorD family protein [Anaerolineae bacterium]